MSKIPLIHPIYLDVPMLVIEGTGNLSSESHELRKESRAYTEASIAILLYHQLQQNNGYIIRN
jgi:hypothetical protein